MKKFASLTLAVLLACALACPALAAGAGALYPAEIVESTEGGYGLWISAWFRRQFDVVYRR